jgi:queuine tRNA-ribosyltransferase
VGYEESAAAVETTTRWAKLSRERWESRGAQAPISGAAKGLLFGIVQGNFFRDLRERSAAELTELDFPGYAIGGLSVGEPAELFAETLGYTAPLLPADRPRYVMGIGTPDYIFAAVENGIDMFDCVLPTRIARNGTVFTTEGRLALKNHRFEKDEAPIDPEWGHPELAGYSRAYVRHLVKSDEILGIMITTLHNLAFMKRLMVEIRRSIAEGRFSSFRDSFLARYRKVGEG